jgi:hypothetical protein
MYINEHIGRMHCIQFHELIVYHGFAFVSTDPREALNLMGSIAFSRIWEQCVHNVFCM